MVKRLRSLVGAEGRGDKNWPKSKDVGGGGRGKPKKTIDSKKKKKKKKKGKETQYDETSTATTSSVTTDLVRNKVVAESGLGDLSQSTLYTSSSLESTSPTYVSLIPWTLRSISAGVTEKYTSCADFRSDLTNAANFLAERTILNYAAWGFGDDGSGENTEPDPGEMDVADAPAKEEQMSSTASDAGAESSYGTNNQVEGADEPDVVKSDGQNVYAAYGDKILAWGADTGAAISETIMPSQEWNDTDCIWGPWLEEDEMITSSTATMSATVLVTSDSTMSPTAPAPDPEDETKSSGTVNGGRRKISFMPPPCDMYRPRPNVRGLLLHGNRLTAFVEGYRNNNANPENPPVLENYSRTVVKVYDTTSFVDVTDDDGTIRKEMVLLSEHDHSGSFLGARAMGSIVHAVYTTGVDTYMSMDRHLNRYDLRYEGMTKEEYIRTATKLATDKVIPSFVDGIIDELAKRRDGGTLGSCADIVPLAVYQSGQLDPTANNWWDSGVLSGLIEISSFDVAAAPVPASTSSPDAKLPTQTTTVFIPSPWSTTMYATTDKLFLGTIGYDEHEELEYIESTYILELDLATAGGVVSPAQAVAVGKVAGTLLNQFSMDYYESHLRVATTIPERWGCANAEVLNDVSFWCDWQMIRGPRNQVTVLSSSDNDEDGVLTPLGQTPHLGKPNESITAVRFMRELGFVVTFERRDPFIVLDLSDPANPFVLGELDVPGWSSYLHPTGEPDEILAVGQDADPGTGMPTSLQISLFGFADRSNPELIARTSVERDDGNGRGGPDDEYSSSEVEWDHKAFRYLPQSKVALLPVTIYGASMFDDSTGQVSYDFFDGFYIFDVNMDQTPPVIAKRFEVNLARQSGGCFYVGYLQARSLVFNGSATLIKGHGAKSVNLQTQNENWSLNFDEDLPKDECWGYWG